MEILSQYTQMPPPKKSLGRYIQEKICPPENRDSPMTFSINASDGISFFGHIEIRTRGMFSGLVYSLELQAHGIVLTIQHSRTDFTNLGEINFSEIIAFHEIQPQEVENFLPLDEKPKMRKPDNRQSEGENCVHRHIAHPAGSQPGIQPQPS